ncbi:hypothetical protein MMC34_000970 [Xylographa carneopallida]|nr:hypothetical protein [Xylographa carneopallida]
MTMTLDGDILNSKIFLADEQNIALLGTIWTDMVSRLKATIDLDELSKSIIEAPTQHAVTAGLTKRPAQEQRRRYGRKKVVVTIIAHTEVQVGSKQGRGKKPEDNDVIMQDVGEAEVEDVGEAEAGRSGGEHSGQGDKRVETQASHGRQHPPDPKSTVSGFLKKLETKKDTWWEIRKEEKSLNTSSFSYGGKQGTQSETPQGGTREGWFAPRLPLSTG